MPPHVIRAKGTRLAKDLEGPFVEDCVPGRVLERAVVSFAWPSSPQRTDGAPLHSSRG